MLMGAFGLFEWELARGESLASARTVAANVFVFCEMFYLFNCRSLEYSMFHVGMFSNLWVIVGAMTMTLMQLLFTYWSPMQKLFGTAAFASREWLLILGVATSVYLIVGMEKLIRRRLFKK
jgi:Ca2+-transporting ATPase